MLSFSEAAGLSLSCCLAFRPLPRPFSRGLSGLRELDGSLGGREDILGGHGIIVGFCSPGRVQGGYATVSGTVDGTRDRERWVVHSEPCRARAVKDVERLKCDPHAIFMYIYTHGPVRRPVGITKHETVEPIDKMEGLTSGWMGSWTGNIVK